MSSIENNKSDSSRRKTRKPGKTSKQPSLAERKRRAGLKNMKDPLFEKYEEIHRIQKELDLQEGARKYAIGIHVAEIVNETKTYGKRAVKQLADVIGLDKSTLVDYGKVAWTWELQDFKDLMMREGILKRGVSFSHLIEIAVREDPAEREEWIDRVLEEGLSVRELRQAIKNKVNGVAADADTSSSDEEDDGVEETATPAGVRRSIARLSSDVKSIPVKAKEWDARVTKPLEADPEQINEAVVDGLKQKRQANNEAIKTLEDENRQIDEILKVARQAKQAVCVAHAEGSELNG